MNSYKSLYSTPATLAKSQPGQPQTTGISSHILGPGWLPSQLLNGSYVPGGATTERHLEVGPHPDPTHSDPLIILSSLSMFHLVSLQLLLCLSDTHSLSLSLRSFLSQFRFSRCIGPRKQSPDICLTYGASSAMFLSII